MGSCCQTPTTPRFLLPTTAPPPQVYTSAVYELDPAAIEAGKTSVMVRAAAAVGCGLRSTPLDSVASGLAPSGA